MPDIWCSFNAFVDYNVYFDENIGDIRHFGKAIVYIMTVQKCKVVPPKWSFRQMQVERERERETETDREKQRQRDTNYFFFLVNFNSQKWLY